MLHAKRKMNDTERTCKNCGRILADYNPTGYCEMCRAKGYDDENFEEVYYTDSGKLGVGEEQTRRYFRKFQKKGYSALPPDWRTRGIKIWKNGRRWCYSFGVSGEEVEAFRINAEIINSICGFAPDSTFSKMIEEALRDYGLEFFLEWAQKWGYDVNCFRQMVRVEKGLPQNRRMGTTELSKAIRRELKKNDKLADKVHKYKTMLQNFATAMNNNDVKT